VTTACATSCMISPAITKRRLTMLRSEYEICYQFPHE
jgi:hypothetical protein